MRVGIFVLFAAWFVNPAEARDSETGRAATKAVALMQSVMGQWKQGCISCHHQTLPILALASARQHGIAVDEPAAQSAAEKVFGYLASVDLAVQYRELADPALVDGYQLTAAHAAGIAPSLTAEIYARRLARWQSAQGHWRTLDGRPPHSSSPFAATALAARAIGLYAPAEARSLERARQWLATAKAVGAEDHAFRLLGLLWTGAPAEVRARVASDALALQRPDGGWGQLPGLESDAYSTGEVLYALKHAAGVSNRNGLDYLLRTQKPDGSWLVETRLHTAAPVSPPYFDSGFPGGKNQFLSCAATAWAVMALAESLPHTPGLPLPVRTALVQGERPWMRTLDDPEAETPEGTTALMMAAHDVAKARLLIERGAKVNARAKSGHDALIVASLYPGNAETLRLLLARGANAKPRKGVFRSMSALFHAALGGDAEMVSLLLNAGGSPHDKSMLFGTFPVRPLEIAVQYESVDAIRTLVKGGAKVDSLDADRMTPLSWAALMHKDEAIGVLLDLGANPRHVDRFGYTPLQHTPGIRHSTPRAAEILEAALR